MNIDRVVSDLRITAPNIALLCEMAQPVERITTKLLKEECEKRDQFAIKYEREPEMDTLVLVESDMVPDLGGNRFMLFRYVGRGRWDVHFLEPDEDDRLYIDKGHVVVATPLTEPLLDDDALVWAVKQSQHTGMALGILATLNHIHRTHKVSYG